MFIKLLSGLGSVALVLSMLGCAGVAEDPENPRFTRADALSYGSRSHKAHGLYNRGDYAEAFPRFLKLARWGDKASQYMLSKMYGLGQGTEMNQIEAMAWLHVAAEARDDWKQQEQQMLKMYTGSERQKIQARGSDYVERYGMKAQDVSCRYEAPVGTRQKVWTCVKGNGFR